MKATFKLTDIMMPALKILVPCTSGWYCMLNWCLQVLSNYVLIGCYDVLSKVDYFPSRYDPVRHAERHPIPSDIVSGRRDKVNFYTQILSNLEILV